jgi:hypothetical protein
VTAPAERCLRLITLGHELVAERPDDDLGALDPWPAVTREVRGRMQRISVIAAPSDGDQRAEYVELLATITEALTAAAGVPAG